MAEAFLRLDQVLARSGHSKTTLYAAIARKEYPAPVKRGRSSLWLESEVQASIDAEAARLISERKAA